MPSETEYRRCLEAHLLPRLDSRMDQWEKEYQQDRDLGQRGEFVGLYRKVRKLKTMLWDSKEVPTDWREDMETILYEVIGHAFLMLHDDCPGDACPLDDETILIHICAEAHPNSPDCWLSRKA